MLKLLDGAEQLISEMQCVVFNQSLARSFLSPRTREACCGVSHSEIYKTIYHFWKNAFLSSITQVTLEDNKDPNNIKLHSDEFFLQDKIITLFHKNDPIGIFFLKWVDLNQAGVLDLNYFADYPEEIIEDFFRENKTKLIIMSYMYVAPAWRRHEKPILIADILPGIAIKYLLETDYDGIIGITRNDYRKAHLIYNRYGWQPLHYLTLFNRPASIVLLSKENINFYSTEIHRHVLLLWQKKYEIANELLDRAI